MLLTKLAGFIYLACVTAIAFDSHAELLDRSVVSPDQLDTPSKTEDAGPITNAQRLANGMIPALPKALKEFMAEKPRKQSAKMYIKRGPACPSASPIVFPPHPPAPTNQVNNFPFQEPYISVHVPFQAKIFSETSNTVWVTDAGLVSFRATSEEQNTPLPTIRAPFDTVFFYWDWILFDENKAGHGIFWANDTNSITARWLGYVAGPATPPGGYPSYNFDATASVALLYL
ncbi:hypothetical protein I302_103704 [Kwoniella bestiolae CBS 10118]|uniref:Uncharacterized protein n=1 Tax=Kwoniella bestiolae CBS 10118 TaxID=1296100 RepID=A0AAJ8K5V4_9TREE